MILIRCDGGELGLWEGEAEDSVSGQRLDVRQVHARVVLDDVNTGFVFVHGLEDNLHTETKISE